LVHALPNDYIYLRNVSGGICKVNNYTFGADPEVFLLKNDELFPAYILLPEYGKGNAKPFTWGGIHADNVMLELNPMPSPLFSDVVENCNQMLRDFCRIHEVFYLAQSYMDILHPEKFLDDYKFKEFGCDPDYSAYTKQHNVFEPLPDTLRVAGGHIMISAPNENLYTQVVAFNAVKWMDILVAPLLPCAGSKASAIRRKWYGKAGCFRPKQFGSGVFGIEYRVLRVPEFRERMLEQASVEIRIVEPALMPVEDRDDLLLRRRSRVGQPA